MSWATRALILMHLDARRGTWCSAENIAATQQIEPAECFRACIDLASARLVDDRAGNGTDEMPQQFRALTP